MSEGHLTELDSKTTQLPVSTPAMDDYDRLLTFYATSFESPPGPTLQGRRHR
jgi:hypothetical protein